MDDELKSKYNNLLDEFKINSELDYIEHKKILDNIKNFGEDKAIEALNLFISCEKSPESLMYLIKLVGKYRSKQSTPVLIDILIWNIDENFDKNKYIKARCMAATALGNIKDMSAVSPIMYMMNSDENYKLRLSCAESLGRIGDRFAVAPLMDIVENEEEKSVYVRESAAKALGMLGDVAALDSLLKVLESKKGMRSKFSFLKESIVEAIVKLHPSDRRTFKALKNSLFDESPQVRLNAIEGLMNIGNDEAVMLIEKMLFDKNEDVSKGATIALYNIKGDDYIVELLKTEGLPIWCKEQIYEIMADDEETY